MNNSVNFQLSDKGDEIQWMFYLGKYKLSSNSPMKGIMKGRLGAGVAPCATEVAIPFRKMLRDKL